MAEFENYKSNTLVSGTSGNDYISNEGKNVTINAANGNDTVYNYGYDNYGSSVQIYTGDGKDSVYNASGKSVTIETGDGNDTVYNNNGNSVSINTGEGNDSVYSYSGKSVTIFAGAGNDTIRNSSKSATISAGKGNDVITLGSSASENVIIYNKGDGNQRDNINECGKHLREEPVAVGTAILQNGGFLPGLLDDNRERVDDAGQPCGHGIHAIGLGSNEPPHKPAVAKGEHPPDEHRGQQG